MVFGDQVHVPFNVVQDGESSRTTACGIGFVQMKDFRNFLRCAGTPVQSTRNVNGSCFQPVAVASTKDLLFRNFLVYDQSVVNENAVDASILGHRRDVLEFGCQGFFAVRNTLPFRPSCNLAHVIRGSHATSTCLFAPVQAIRLCRCQAVRVGKRYSTRKGRLFQHGIDRVSTPRRIVGIAIVGTEIAPVRSKIQIQSIQLATRRFIATHRKPRIVQHHQLRSTGRTQVFALDFQRSVGGIRRRRLLLVTAAARVDISFLARLAVVAVSVVVDPIFIVIDGPRGLPLPLFFSV